MTNAEILSLAYQRQAQGDNRDLSVIIAEVKVHLAQMQPSPPKPTDIIGFKSEIIGGVKRKYNVLGNGSQVEVQS